MDRALTVEVPETVYGLLLQVARQRGQTVQELIVEWLTRGIQATLEDPLERFIGAFRSDIPGWAERHDEYIGRTTLE